MRLLKPSWVSHDGKPIFSIDIHPDGSRFATGGQGDNAGRVVVWNMAPVKEESSEEDEKVPKLLCQLDNHLACVNSVRWSNNGKYLASGGDDKLIMIWQTSRYSSASSVFGSEGKLVNLEQWRCVNTLRGHSGDVLDLAWSPQDLWLATCSIDNTIVVWNANKFPEQLAVLKGHTGLVKGVTWDPVGKYLASQSDDKSLRVWRTLDWQQETCVTEPFQECGGTTHVLRLGWSPDGHYLVSAHAMNNSGPTAQIIERSGWKVAMDFVGHRKAVTVVRFNPNILSKKIKKTSDKAQQYSCCAIGSRDRSLSIWLTALKRPLVVTHDLFSNSILDISWSQTGMELLCCSWDGTVAYLDFTIDELGTPLTLEEKHQLHQHVYGKSLAMSNATSAASQIIETTAMLKLQQDREKKTQAKTPSAPVANGTSEAPGSGAPASPSRVGPSSSASNGSSVFSSPTHKQIETKTKDGRRRITPIFLAPQPDLGEVPLPFTVASVTCGNSNSMFTTTTEQSKIVVEKKSDGLTSLAGSSGITLTPSSGTDGDKPTSIVFDTSTIQPITKMAALESKTGDVSKTTTPTPSTIKAAEKEKPKLPVKRKLEPEPPPTPLSSTSVTSTPLSTTAATATPASQPPVKKKDGRGRPRKYPLPEQAKPPPPPQQTVVIEKPAQIIYATSGLGLPIPNIEKAVSIQIAGSVGSDSAWVVEVENSIAPSLHQVRCVQGGSLVWDSLLSNRIIAVAGNSHVVCTACQDNSVNLMSATSGRRLLPSLILDSKVSTLRCSGFFIMAITSKGQLYVWNIQTMAAVIKNESLVSIISNNSVKLESSLLTEQGLPVVTLSSGRSYTFKVELGCWVLLSSQGDKLQMCSDHESSLPPTGEASRRNGPLATLQAHTQKPGRQAALLFQSNPALQQPSTLSHLENQVACSLALQSYHEYHFWLLTYVRYLVSQGQEKKLREICDDLLGPLYRSKSHSKWQPTVLGYNKRKLLEEILPVVGSNLSLQRLFTEYQEQLDTVKT